MPALLCTLYAVPDELCVLLGDEKALVPWFVFFLGEEGLGLGRGLGASERFCLSTFIGWTYSCLNSGLAGWVGLSNSAIGLEGWRACMLVGEFGWMKLIQNRVVWKKLNHVFCLILFCCIRGCFLCLHIFRVPFVPLTAIASCKGFHLLYTYTHIYTFSCLIHTSTWLPPPVPDP